jgi:ADP-heptose:LPS heptosyltransferase
MGISIAILRLSSMGDVLLATPLLRQIRSRYPDARLDMIVDERFAECVRHNPHITNVREYSRAERMLTDSSRQRYDAVIDLQRNNRSRQILRGVQHDHQGTLHKHRWQKLKLVYLKRGFDQAITPIAERYRQAAQIQGLLSIPDDDDGLELWLPEERAAQMYPPLAAHDAQNTRNTHNTHSTLTIAIAPGAHHATKRWLPERFAQAAIELAERCRKKYPEIIVTTRLLGGVADKEQCDIVERWLRNAQKQASTQITVHNDSGATSLCETARLLDSAAVLLTNDTGAMHIAAARRVPVVAVFGSTVQEFGFAPFRVASSVVEAHRDGTSGVPCRPCTHTGRASCPKQHFRCMNAVTVEAVVQAAAELVL